MQKSTYMRIYILYAHVYLDKIYTKVCQKVSLSRQLKGLNIALTLSTSLPTYKTQIHLKNSYTVMNTGSSCAWSN